MRSAVFLFGIVLATQAAPLYQLTNLGNLDGRSAVAYDISNTGAIAGSGVAAHSRDYAAAWNVADSVLLGMDANGDAVNLAGHVAGTDWSSGRPQATVWRNGTKQTVVSGQDSYGLGINDSGQVVGGTIYKGRMNAFVTGPDGVQQLQTPGGWSSAYDINNSGQAVGTYENGSGFTAFSWTQSGGVQTIGSLGGHNSYAMSVSDNGLIAGSSTARSGYLHAFLYNGTMQDLGTLGGGLSAAYGVNVFGQAVGYSYDAAGRQRGFVWYDGMLLDLNDLIEPGSGWTVNAAYGINDLGQIVGSAVRGGSRVAVLLDPLAGDDPIAPDVSNVPEPGTGLLIGAAALGWAAFRWLRRK